jgi:ABC-type sugar transport system substrate-binding protein
MQGNWPSTAVQSALDRAKGEGITVAAVVRLEEKAVRHYVGGQSA